jgi:hypothetical protein
MVMVFSLCGSYCFVLRACAALPGNVPALAACIDSMHVPMRFWLQLQAVHMDATQWRSTKAHTEAQCVLGRSEQGCRFLGFLLALLWLLFVTPAHMYAGRVSISEIEPAPLDDLPRPGLTNPLLDVPTLTSSNAARSPGSGCIHTAGGCAPEDAKNCKVNELIDTAGVSLALRQLTSRAYETTSAFVREQPLAAVAVGAVGAATIAASVFFASSVSRRH